MSCRSSLVVEEAGSRAREAVEGSWDPWEATSVSPYSLVVVEGSWEPGKPPMSRRDSLVVVEGSRVPGKPPMSRRDSLVVVEGSRVPGKPPTSRCAGWWGWRGAGSQRSHQRVVVLVGGGGGVLEAREATNESSYSLVVVEGCWKPGKPPMSRRDSLVVVEGIREPEKPPTSRCNSLVVLEGCWKPGIVLPRLRLSASCQLTAEPIISQSAGGSAMAL